MYQALLHPAGVRAGPLPGFGEKSWILFTLFQAGIDDGLRPRGKWIEFECLAKHQPSNQPIGLQNMYYVAASQPTEGFMVPKICYMYSLFLPLDPWKQHNVSNKRRSQIPILSPRLSAIPQSQQQPPLLPAPFKRQFRHPIWCIWQWQTRILLSFFLHTYMHIKYHMDRYSCLCNGLVQAVATKLVYSSSIYCTYLVFSTVSSSNYVLLN